MSDTPTPGPAPGGVPIAPVPSNWSIGRGQMGTENIVLVNVATPIGQFTFVVPAANAGELGRQIIAAATGGLQIATGMPPVGPPPRG
jgi:hypothetical protein